MNKRSYEPGVNRSGRHRGYGWYHIPQWDITIATPPKAGSSSLKNFMWENKIECSYIPQKLVKGPTFFVIRDPVSRFCSLWRDKCRDQTNIIDRNIYGMTPQELLTHIQHNNDVHWTPQYKLFGNLSPTIIPLERLNDWWEEQGYGTLNQSNMTSGSVDINPKKIVDYYWKDMELYTRACLV